MKLNQDGTIRLQFDSGRELDVNELYNDISKPNMPSELKTSANLEANKMDNAQLNGLNFKDIGIMQNGKITSLKRCWSDLYHQLIK